MEWLTKARRKIPDRFPYPRAVRRSRFDEVLGPMRLMFYSANVEF